MHIRKKECSRSKCQAPPLLEASKMLLNSKQYKSLLEKQFWKDEFKDLLKINLEKKFATRCGNLTSQQKLELLLDSPNTRHRYFLKRKFSPEKHRELHQEPEDKFKMKKKGREVAASLGKASLRAVRRPTRQSRAKQRGRGRTVETQGRRGTRSKKDLKLASRVTGDVGTRFVTPKLGEIRSAAELLGRKKSKVKIKTSIAQHVKHGLTSSKGLGMTMSTRASSQALLVHSLQRKWTRLSKSKDMKVTPQNPKRRRGTPKQIASFWKTTSEGKLWKSYKKLPERPRNEVMEDNRQLLNLFRHNSQMIKQSPKNKPGPFSRRRVTLAKMESSETSRKENINSENTKAGLREDPVANIGLKKRVHDSRVKTENREKHSSPDHRNQKLSVFSPMKSTFYQIIKNLPKARPSKINEKRYLQRKISKFIQRQSINPLKGEKPNSLQKNFMFENKVGSVRVKVSMEREKRSPTQKNRQEEEIFVFDKRGKLKNKSKHYSTIYHEGSDGWSKERRSVSQTKRETGRSKAWGSMKKRFQSVEDLMLRMKKKRSKNSDAGREDPNNAVSIRKLEHVEEVAESKEQNSPSKILKKIAGSWDKFSKDSEQWQYDSKLVNELRRFKRGMESHDQTYMMIQRHKLLGTTPTKITTQGFDSKYRGNINGSFNDMFDYRAMEFSNRVKDFFFSKNKGILKEIFNHLKEEMFLQRVKPMILDLCFWTWVMAKDVYRESGKNQKTKSRRAHRTKQSTLWEERSQEVSRSRESRKSKLLGITSNMQSNNPSFADKIPTSSTLKPGIQGLGANMTAQTLDINIQVKPALDNSHSGYSKSVIQGGVPVYAKKAYTTQGTKKKRASGKHRPNRSQINISKELTKTQRQEEHYNKPRRRRRSVNRGRNRSNKTCEINKISRRNSKQSPGKRHKRKKSIRHKSIRRSIVYKDSVDSFVSSVDTRKPSKRVKFLSKMNFETEMAHTTETCMEQDQRGSKLGMYSLNISRDTSQTNNRRRSKSYKFQPVNFEIPIEICLDDKEEVAGGKIIIRGLELCGEYIPENMKKMQNELKESEFTVISQQTLKQTMQTFFLDVFSKTQGSICSMMPFTSEEDLEDLQLEIEKEKMKMSLQKPSDRLQAQMKFLQANQSMELGVIEKISMRKNNSIRENEIIELTEQIVSGLGSHHMAENLQKRHRESDFKIKRRGSCAMKRPVNLLDARRKSILILNKLNKIKNRRLNELLNCGDTYKPAGRLIRLEHGLQDFLQIVIDYLSMKQPTLNSKRLKRFRGSVEEGDARLHLKDHFGIGLFKRYRFQSAEIRKVKGVDRNLGRIHLLLNDKKIGDKMLSQDENIWEGGTVFRDSKMLQKMGLNVHEGMHAVDVNDDRVIKVTSFKRKSKQFDFLKNTKRQRKEMLAGLKLRKTERMERLLALTSFLSIIQQSALKRVYQHENTFLNSKGASQTKVRRDSVMQLESMMKNHFTRPSVLSRVRESLKSKLKNFSKAFGAIIGGRVKPEKRRLRQISRNRRHGMFLSEGFQKKHIQFQYWSLLKNGELNGEISTVYENEGGAGMSHGKKFDVNHFGELHRGESFAKLTAAVKDMRSAFNILTRSRFVLGLDSLGQIVYYKSHFRDQINGLLQEDNLSDVKIHVGYYKMIRLEKSRTVEIETKQNAVEIPLRKARTIKETNKAKMVDGVFWEMNLEVEESKGKQRLEVMDAMLKKVYKDVAREKIFEFNFRQLQWERD